MTRSRTTSSQLSRSFLAASEVIATEQMAAQLFAEKREIKPPTDFVKAQQAAPRAWEHWRELSYSHQREFVEAIEQAKKPETRARRLEAAVRMIAARPAKKQK